MAFQTEYSFTLPKGYIDEEGTLHKEGTMRLATAADEILPMKDPRVQANPAYLTIILLSRVITRPGTLDAVTPGTIENLFTADLQYLQSFYTKINEAERRKLHVVCPKCSYQFDVEESLPGE